MTSTRTSRPATTPGISACAWCPTAICSRRSATARASVVTDHIETFTESGIRLNSGAELEADIVVTATGLKLLALGGMRDRRRRPRGRAARDDELQGHDAQRRAEHGVRHRLHQRLVDAQVRPDLRVRLPAAEPHGRARLRQCTPRNRDPSVTELPFIDFSSGYVQRSIDKFPQQGSKAPWRLYQNYALDILMLQLGAIEDGAMRVLQECLTK